MADKATAEKIEAEIPYSAIDYTASFKAPVIKKWAPANLIPDVLKVLEPWGFGIDGVEARNREKLSELAIVFRRGNPDSPNVTITVGVAKVTVTVENPDWSEAEGLIAGVSAGLEAVIQTCEVEIEKQQLGLVIHIQLKTKPRKDVVAPLLSPLAFELLDGDVKFPGIILQREGSSILIDASVAYANALFVRILREHSAKATLQELADTLRKDEEKLFAVLGLEGTL